MAQYTFETISAAQALAFGASDTLVVASGTARATQFRVRFEQDPGNATTPASTLAVLTDQATGVSKTFSANLLGDEVAFPLTGSSLYVGSNGADTQTLTETGAAAFGGADADSITGLAGDANWLQGNQGADTILGGGGAGNDTIFGGQGNDIIDLGNASGAVFAQGNAGDDTILGGSATGRNTLIGGQGNDEINGGAGADYLTGDLGNDTIVGNGGNDTVLGGAGNDTLTVTLGAGDDVSLSGGDGNDTLNVNSSGTHTAVVDVQGNAGNDTINANDNGAANYRGGQGNDLITLASGLAGAKLLAGDLGDDTLAGVANANDTLLGGDGSDVLTFTSTGFSTSIDAGAGNDSITVTHGAGVGNDTILGGDGNDTVTIAGNAGYTGSEFIDAGNGNDLITAGDSTGNDTLIGGAGDDTINASAKVTSGTQSIEGGAGNDLITASDVGDSINGGDGADTIVAGEDRDILLGGSGADLFDFSASTSSYTIGSQDQIRDWEATDKIEFGGVAGAATNYTEVSATDYAQAQTLANLEFGTRDYVAVQVGADVVVFHDANNSGTLNSGDEAVVLVGRSLTDIDSSNIV